MADTKFKPVGYNPRGWQLRPIFVDDEGNVWERGQHQPDKKGTLPHSKEADGPPPEGQVSEQQSPQPTESDPIADPFQEAGVTPELIEKLTKIFDDKFKKEKEEMMVQFEDRQTRSFLL